MAKMGNYADSPAAARSGESIQQVRDRWAGEISRPEVQGTVVDWRNAQENIMQYDLVGEREQTESMQPMQPMNDLGAARRYPKGRPYQDNQLELSNPLPDEVIESPTTMTEAYLGSLKAMLKRNEGNYIVASFLIGNQMVSWEGILYDVGNDYVTIYQPGQDRYIVTDIYSLKYIEFYDTRGREIYNQKLRRKEMPDRW